MATHYGAIYRGQCLNPIDVKSLSNPLAFIAEDHLRTRQICTLIDTTATHVSPDQADLERILTYLNTEFAIHLADEDEHLFPLLRKRCEPEDEIEKLLDRLGRDHAAAREQAPHVRDSVAQCMSRANHLSIQERDVLLAFSKNLRRHLIFENAIVLPLAHARLNEHDLGELRQSLTARRTGRRTLEGPPHA